jgi:hypothetical protein
MNFGLRVTIAFEHLSPRLQGRVLFAQLPERFRIHHQRRAIFMLRIFVNDFLQDRPRFFGPCEAQQTLTVMGDGVDVFRIAFQSGDIFFLRIAQFALREINVSELRMMVRFVKMMNLILQFLYATPLPSAGQFEGRRVEWLALAIDHEEIKNRAEHRE